MSNKSSINALTAHTNSISVDTVADFKALRGVPVGFKVIIGERGDSTWVAGASGSFGAPDEMSVIEGDGVDLRVQPNNGVVSSDAFGITGSGDEASKIQALWDYCGSNGYKWLVTVPATIGSTLYIKNHISRGETREEFLFTGSGACVDFTPVGVVYPVSCEIHIQAIRLTAANQTAVIERCSSSKVFFRATISDPACTDCTALRSLGDSVNGTGPYYNEIQFKAQGGHQDGTVCHTTETSDGDFTGTRGPNANTYIIERSGQFDNHIIDRVGSGNTWIIRTAEAAGAETSTLITAGHDSISSGLSQNQYYVQYTENVDNTFVSDASKFGTGLKLFHNMATGGQSVSDLASNNSSQAGILIDQRSPSGVVFDSSSSRPLKIRTDVTVVPRIESSGAPAFDFYDLGNGNYLRLQSSQAFSSATHALRFLVGTTEFMRCGTTRWSPVTDNTKALGASSERFAQTYSRELRPGDGSPIWTSGAGTPEGVIAAPVGSMYTRTDGGAGTTLYVKESGAGNTGWVAK